MKPVVALMILSAFSLPMRAQVSFTLASSPGVGSGPAYVAVADVNGDGEPDLITANGGNNTFSVLTNNGSGGFVLSSSPAVSGGINTVLAVDVNGDGMPDLVTAGYGSNAIFVLTNNGSGGFVLSSSPAVGSLPIGLCAGEVNGDGKVDLMAANSATQDSTVSVVTNNGTGGFATAGKYAVGSNPWCVVAADVNGDGKLDLITANYAGNTLSVLTNNGSGGFATAGTYPVGANPRSVLAVDVNGDGKVDLISANYSDNTISVLTNNGNGGFVSAAAYPVGSQPVFVAAADVNGDGAVDLVVANYGDSTLLVLTNNGSGGFATAATNAVGSNPRVVVAADVNGDGKVDLITANYSANTISILTNGTAFPPPSAPIITTQPAGQTNLIGTRATFSAVARANAGVQQFSYQWRFDGTNLPAATNNVLTLTNLALSQAGSYAVVITNSAGSVTSNPAMLDVLFIEVEANGQLGIGMVTALAPATVTLLGGYPGGFLFYTLDGSTPTINSTYCTGPFTLTNSATVSVLSYSADFTQNAAGIPVNVQVIPTYSLQTAIIGNGTLSTNPPSGPYASNSVVSLTATAALHWSFAYWTGDASGSQNPLNLTMNGSHNVQAVFVQSAYPLTLTTPGGGGVTANGQVIAAATYYPTGSVVSLSATASNGWSFLGWQGSILGTNNPLSLAINQTNSIQATFGTVATTNSVGGSIVLGQPNPIPYGTVLTASAIPNAGNYFVAWNGSVSGTNAPAKILVTNANPSVGALFAPLPAGKYTLSVVVNGNGFVTNNPSRNYYNSGDSVTLTATNYPGIFFLGWTQDAIGTNNPQTVSMTTNKLIQANFGVTPSVSISPLNPTLLAGSNGVLTASALGLPPLAYQWQNSQGAIAGATNTFLLFFNAQPTNAGSYSVVVSNASGSATSAVATVTVIGFPTITNQPSPVTVTVGHAASFGVGASGWPALAYQWRLNGTGLAGATNPALTLSNTFPANAGNYTLTLTNVYGSITSNPARLTVLPLNLTTPAGATRGQLQFTFDTALGINYAIQYSTNLTVWYPWLNLSGIGQPLTLTDPNTAAGTQHYYRVLLSPQ